MRHEFHTHTIYSDGELLPSELVRRAIALKHKTIALTDHGDISNYKELIQMGLETKKELKKYWDIEVIAGIELTHIPPKSIPKIAKKCKDEGVELVVVHGETLVEPVEEKTNYYSSLSEDVDILAHGGLIDDETGKNLKENDIYLEITSRKGHSLSNGHVLNVARKYNIPTVINTDSHAPSDLISFEFAEKVGFGCGMTQDEVKKSLINNPLNLLDKIKNNIK
ncbi:histidinol phosphate phosphatase domain-containing protein [Methanococcus voltae]|uniref:histidinol phosphate phosphatase domain-containing protein n=1 Tax=Methanococcus voltae TaxID=2188 RepID=UPI001AE4C413|nr:histidinol phosphate phosphatase domain-containing protein [Methanococcus voltae]MBP2172424.1 histidinol phosphatase-like PHP family hydrolase [Methanococcus voltae]